MSFKDWLVDTVTVEVLPSPALPYIFLVLSSFAGGWIYAHSGSWTYAIVADALCYAWLWFGVRHLVEWIGAGVVKAVLFILP
jgi:hypothetical protein